MELEKVQKIIGEVLEKDPDDIGEDMAFIDDLGADSLDIYQIITGLEDEFKIEIPEEEVTKIVTVGDATKAISKLIG